MANERVVLELGGNAVFQRFAFSFLRFQDGQELELVLLVAVSQVHGAASLVGKLAGDQAAMQTGNY